MYHKNSTLIFLVLILNVSIIATTSIDNTIPDATGDSHIVNTLSGPIEGTVVKGFTDLEVSVYYGIPYAEPPINELRFKPPKPVHPWTDVLKATEKPLPCYQQYTEADMEANKNENTFLYRPWSEDCLKLNIWTPNPTPTELPVLVMFHSGSFLTGTGTFPNIDGATLSAESNIIVVTMNYRLGAFGFLSYFVPEAPGNMGLLDQQLAMNWVHKNINFFRGKTEAIILFGAGGAGSASVGYQVISSQNAGLFKTAGIFGGAVTCPWAFHSAEKSKKKALQLAAKLGCTNPIIEKEIECLRGVHPEDIVDADSSEFLYSSDQFKPTVDGTFITEPPIESMKAGRFNKVVLLAVTNAHEGSMLLKTLNPDVMSDSEKGIDKAGFRKAVQRVLPHLGDNALTLVEDRYIDKCREDDHEMLRDAAIRVYSDAFFDCCMNKLVDYTVQNGAVAFRVMDDLRKELKPAWVGSQHGSSVWYAIGFGMAGEQLGYTRTEMNMSKFFMEWIYDHIHKRNTEMVDDLPFYNLEDKPYVYWDAVGPTTHHDLRGPQCSLWDNILPMFRRKDKHCT